MTLAHSSYIPLDEEDLEIQGLVRVLQRYPTATSPCIYRNRRVAFLTQHGKEQVVAPILSAGTESHVERIDGFDTDLFGTFTRDVERDGTQLEAARRKATQGMELSGLPLGLGSEGSFGSHPTCGFLPWNVEMLVWIDAERNLEIVGVSATGTTNYGHLKTGDWDEVLTFAGNAGFSDHHLVLRPNHQDDVRIRKGIADVEELEDAFAWAAELATDGEVFVETDMRAHANPTRMANIAAAADDLAQKLRSLCPACEMPGFSVSERVTGLPCELCHEPTELSIAEIHCCQSCGYRETRELNSGTGYASAAVCQYCNP